MVDTITTTLEQLGVKNSQINSEKWWWQECAHSAYIFYHGTSFKKYFKKLHVYKP